MRQDELWPVPTTAEGLTLAGLALERVVAAERTIADEKGTGLLDQLVHNGIRAEIVDHPRHIAART